MPQIDNPFDPRQSVVAAALQAKQNMFNRSNVQLGKVVFGSCQIPDNQNNFSADYAETSTAIAIPKFATVCSYILTVNALGTHSSGPQYLLLYPEVICGEVDQTVYRNTTASGTETSSASVSSTLSGTFVIPTGQSSVTFAAWASGTDDGWTGCHVLGNALVLFQY